MSIKRRKFLKAAIALPVLASSHSSFFRSVENFFHKPGLKRIRPGDPLWPSDSAWQKLNETVGGSLIKIESPLVSCKDSPGADHCDEVFRELKNPYYIGDHPALTQTTGWSDAWTSRPSVFAVAAKSTSDVVAAVQFARTYNLRLVVKGGGHSYQGTSNAGDSLLIWTKAMNKIDIQEHFLAAGCASKQNPQPAVTIESGAIWMQVYDAVTTRGGKYVQGGGCATVGVAGLIQSGGFGSYSKKYGLAAAGLLEAEIVLADGSVKIANACTNPDLFWALKGGGGGSFGVLTKITLRTRELPVLFSRITGKIKARDDASFQLLITKILIHYKEHLFNPHWGEQMTFNTDNTIGLNMNYQGPGNQMAESAWMDFENWVHENPGSYSFTEPLQFHDIPARHYWDPVYLRKYFPERILTDDRPGEPSLHAFWTGSREEAGIYLYGYRSTWLPASLLEKDELIRLSEAVFAATRSWAATFHFNKGLAGAPSEEIEAAKNTAMNPDVLNAFALVIVAGGSDPVFPGIAGHEPDLKVARLTAEKINLSFNQFLKRVPDAGSYVSEGDFFEKNWQQAYWGAHYPRLAEIKRKYDPEGLFFVHHGVGSEEWTDDGFEKK